MHKIINKQIVAQSVRRLNIKAPDITAKIEPGQFVMIALEENGPRIPLFVVDVEQRKGAISVIVQETNGFMRQLGESQIGDEIYSVLGPLGKPAKIDKVGTVACVASGTGIANILPLARAFKRAGNKTVAIIGAKTKKDLMLETQMRITSSKIIITTEDGTSERKGLATNALKELIDHEPVDLVYVTGSADLMQGVVEMTKKRDIKTRVQLNPVMLDGTGMCGSCRVMVDGQQRLACVDGPEFDGFQVDFDSYRRNINTFKEAVLCLNPRFQSSTKKSGQKITKKFLSGILKK